MADAQVARPPAGRTRQDVRAIFSIPKALPVPPPAGTRAPFSTRPRREKRAALARAVEDYLILLAQETPLKRAAMPYRCKIFNWLKDSTHCQRLWTASRARRFAATNCSRARARSIDNASETLLARGRHISLEEIVMALRNELTSALTYSKIQAT